MDAAFDDAVRRALASARTARPDLKVSDDVFVSFVSKRFVDENGKYNIESLNAADALLAAGCLAQETSSLQTFSREIEPVIHRAVSRVLRDGGHDSGDATGRVIMRLLYGENGPAKLESYLATGPLAGWAQVAATRFALNIVRDNRARGRREQVRQLDDRAAENDVELEHIRDRYRDEFGIAFKQALSGLEVRDRNVLRYYLLDSLSIDEIGAIYNVHRATAARWVTGARERLLVEVKTALAARLKITDAELESLFVAVRSHLDVSLGSFLNAGPEDEG